MSFLAISSEKLTTFPNYGEQHIWSKMVIFLGKVTNHFWKFKPNPVRFSKWRNLWVIFTTYTEKWFRLVHADMTKGRIMKTLSID